MNVSELLRQVLDGDEGGWIPLRQRLEAQISALVAGLVPDDVQAIRQTDVVNRAIDRIRRQVLRVRASDEGEFDRIVIRCSREELVAALAQDAAGWMTRLLERQLHGGPYRPQAKFSPSEVWQQTHCAAVQNADRFFWQGTNAFRGWLRTIARNVIRGHDRFWRSKRNDIRRELPQTPDSETTPWQQLFPSAEPSPSTRLVTGETVAQVLEAMNSFDVLSADQQRALHLRYVEGTPLCDIAIEMDRTVDAVKMLISRGLGNLRDHLRRNSLAASDVAQLDPPCGPRAGGDAQRGNRT